MDDQHSIESCGGRRANVSKTTEKTASRGDCKKRLDERVCMVGEVARGNKYRIPPDVTAWPGVAASRAAAVPGPLLCFSSRSYFISGFFVTLLHSFHIYIHIYIYFFFLRSFLEKPCRYLRPAE